MINWGGWKSLTKNYEFTQNLHEFERIRAIWENISESFQNYCSNFLNGKKSKFRKLTPPPPYYYGQENEEF